MKNNIIKEIKQKLTTIFDTEDSVSIGYCELEMNSPVIQSIGNRPNISILVDVLFQSRVGVCTYSDENFINETLIPYEELSYDILKQINDDLTNYLLSF